MTESIFGPEKRDVGNVLQFRRDYSPFLIHLTRDTERTAEQKLINILSQMRLDYGNNRISNARFGYDVRKLNNDIEITYFSAVSFTETPLNEIHNFLGIIGTFNFQPYGLVFLKEKCEKKCVSPVIYINNEKGDKDKVVQYLCKLIDNDPQEARKILPYIAIFGKKLNPIGGVAPEGDYDFRWEREWRYASDEHYFDFGYEDLFIGLCPDNKISEFESAFAPLRFIDPIRNIRWYAEKLVTALREHNLNYHLV